MLGALRARLASILAPEAANVVSVKSSGVARDRLAIILAHQRSSVEGTSDVLSGVDLKSLQADLLDCVKVRAIPARGPVHHEPLST